MNPMLSASAFDVQKLLYRSRLNFSMSVILVKEGIQLFNRKILNRIGIRSFAVPFLYGLRKWIFFAL